MSSQAHIGANRTGLMASPQDAKRLLEADAALESVVTGDMEDFIEIKVQAIEDADPLGSVPPPASIKGVVKTGVKLISGSKPSVFIDKLAERAAYERGGTRLYDALIVKFQSSGDAGSGATLPRLIEIRADELAHYHLVVDAIRSLGGDPTAQTPSADIVGVETAGLMQVLNDPRTTFGDCLNAMLIAELTDVDAWSLLAQLADDIGEDKLAARFRDALLHENHHLQDVRQWYQSSVRELQG
ncbi:MAG TPA: ferritin-like domain-containing protein [Nitrospira sp.]|nr:ferritin-like domain-containing protein [Nitrospira sp.]